MRKVKIRTKTREAVAREQTRRIELLVAACDWIDRKKRECPHLSTVEIGAILMAGLDNGTIKESELMSQKSETTV